MTDDTYILLIAILMFAVVVACSLLVYQMTTRRMDRRYQKVIDQYLKADTMILNHVRDHTHRDGDKSWLAHAPNFVFFEFMDEEPPGTNGREKIEGNLAPNNG